MTVGPQGPSRQAGGAPGFNVMVASVDALNASIRQLSQDLQRASNAQQQFTPGGGAPQPGQPSPPGQQPTPPPRQTSSQGSYNPGAGRTTQQSLGQAARQYMQRIQQHFTQPQQPQPGGQPQPQQQAPHIPPQLLYYGGAPYGPQGPYGGPGGPMGPQGPMGPYSGSQPPYGGGGPAYWFAGSSHGGGWMNAGIGAARRLPVVGPAIGAVAGINNLYLSEREKNRFYQNIEGGSNLQGMGERAHEEVYRWSLGMGMSGDMARRSFKGVTALGYTGRSQGAQGRQDALNFVYHNYNARGMDPEESLSMLQTASKDATVNFTELSEALKEVSDTAGKAGVNARFMRQNFQGMLESSIGTGAGPGAADIARTLTATQASYGKEFQNVEMRGQLSRDYRYMVGAQYGVTPGQVQGIMRNQPQQYARMVAGSQREMINMVFPPQQQREIQDLIKKYGTSEQAIDQIEQEFLNNHPEIDLVVIAETLSGALTGIELDESNVMDWVIQQIAGNTAAAHGDQRTGSALVDIQTKGKRAGQPKAGQTAKTGKFGLVAPGDQKMMEDYGTTDPAEYLKHVNAGKEFLGIFGQEENKAGEAYVNRMNKTKKRDPVLEAILQNITDPNNTKVKVNTAKGERIVSLEEAMKLFPNELATGKVQIVSGEQAGKTISDVVGGNVDPDRDIKGELSGEAQGKAGQGLKDYEKKHGPLKGSNPAGGKVVVDLTTEAKRLLQLLPSTNNQGQATGYPPYNPHAQQGSRP